MITEGRERTDGFGTSGQQPDTLVQWKYEPRNALYYDSSHRDAVPFSGAWQLLLLAGACCCVVCVCVWQQCWRAEGQVQDARGSSAGICDEE